MKRKRKQDINIFPLCLALKGVIPQVDRIIQKPSSTGLMFTSEFESGNLNIVIQV